MANEITPAAPVAPAEITPKVTDGLTPLDTKTPAPPKVTSKTLDEFTGEELDRLLAGEKPFPDDPEPAKEEVQPDPPEPPAGDLIDDLDPDAVETPEEIAEREKQAAEEAEKKKLAKNYRLQAVDEKQAKFFQLLKRNPDIDPIEAAIQAGYAPKAAAQAVKEATPAEPVKPVDPLQPKRDKLTELFAEKKKHREAYELDKADEVGDQIDDLREEILRAELESREQQKTAIALQNEVAGNIERAGKLHPKALEDDSVQAALLASIGRQLAADNPEFFANPRYPLLMVAAAEAKYPEHFPKRAKAGTPVTTPPAVTQPVAKVTPKPSRPLGEAIPASTGAKNAPNRQDLRSKIDALTDPDELSKLMARS